MKRKYFFSILGLLAFTSVASALTTSTILPTSNGNYTSWTPSTGASHFVLVDESTCNGVTDYNSTNVNGNRDSYGVSLASVPNGSKITDIAITPCASRNQNGGGSATLNVFYRYNGSNSSDSGAYALTGTTPAGLAATTFSSLNFIKSSTSTLESGAVLTSGTRGARLSRIGTVITYTSLTISTSTSFLTSTAVSTSQINLAWSDVNSIEDGYLVERSSISVSGPFTQIATTSVNAVSYNDTGLTANTKYWYRIKAFNYGGESSYSNTASTTTFVNAPVVLTDVATSISTSSAKFNGSANPNGGSTTGWFRYSTTTPGTCNDTFGSKYPFSNIALGSGTSSVNYSSSIFGLTSSTTYYYCAVASNTGGNGFGSVESFTTTP